MTCALTALRACAEEAAEDEDEDALWRFVQARPSTPPAAALSGSFKAPSAPQAQPRAPRSPRPSDFSVRTLACLVPLPHLTVLQSTAHAP